jgi:hypothetical protein
MNKLGLGGRVVVHGPNTGDGYAGIVTKVFDDGSVSVACMPHGSNTLLLANGIIVGRPHISIQWWCEPAPPELLSVEMGMQAFVDVLRPLVDTAVAAALAEREQGEA